MSNLFLREPTYITIDQIKDTSSKTWLIALTDDEIKVLISKSEDAVDRYIIKYWVPFDEDQTLIFPIIWEYWTSYIPNDIIMSTFYIVEQIYESGDLISWAVSSSSGWAITSEKTWDRTVQYSSDSVTTTNNALKFLWVPPEAENILKKYKNIFIKNII